MTVFFLAVVFGLARYFKFLLELRISVVIMQHYFFVGSVYMTSVGATSIKTGIFRLNHV